MKRYVVLAFLLGLILGMVAAPLFLDATDSTWRMKVKSGLSTGSLIYAIAPGTLTNIDAVAIGQTLVSAGASTKPAWSATPRLGKQLRTYQATAPACADTGKCSGIVGTDSAGLITIGATPANGFVVTFNATWSSAPACVVQNQTSAANYVTKTATTTTTMTVTSAAGPTASDVYSYVCLGPS